MTNKMLSLELSPEIIEQLDLDGKDSVTVTLDAERLTLLKEEERQVRTIPNWGYLVGTLIATAFFYGFHLWQQTRQVLLAGDYSITGFLVFFGVLFGMGFFTINFILNRRIFLDGLKSRLFWRMFPVITMAFSIILAVLLLGFSWLVNQLFRGASFDLNTSALLFAIMIYTVSSFWSRIAELLRASWLTSLFTLIMLSGVLLSMATNSSKQWWQVNLSFLGTKEAQNSWQFNLTLMLSALILIALVDYLFVALSQKFGHNKRLMILRVLLTLLGLDLWAVGYFSNDAASHLIHTRLAGYLVYILLALIIGIRWLLPKVSRDFILTSYVIGGVLVVLEFAFQGIHYLSLTAFEMSAFLLAFSWLMALFKHLENLISPEKRQITLKLLKCSN